MYRIKYNPHNFGQVIACRGIHMIMSFFYNDVISYFDNDYFYISKFDNKILFRFLKYFKIKQLNFSDIDVPTQIGTKDDDYKPLGLSYRYIGIITKKTFIKYKSKKYGFRCQKLSGTLKIKNHNIILDFWINKKDPLKKDKRLWTNVFKTWASGKNGKTLIKTLKNIQDEVDKINLVEDLFDSYKVPKNTCYVGYDSSSSWDQSETGFSLNVENIETKLCPLTELLSVIGLQGCEMNVFKSEVLYTLWTDEHYFADTFKALNPEFSDGPIYKTKKETKGQAGFGSFTSSIKIPEKQNLSKEKKSFIKINFINKTYGGRDRGGNLQWPPDPLRIIKAIISGNKENLYKSDFQKMIKDFEIAKVTEIKVPKDISISSKIKRFGINNNKRNAKTNINSSGRPQVCDIIEQVVHFNNSDSIYYFFDSDITYMEDLLKNVDYFGRACDWAKFFVGKI